MPLYDLPEEFPQLPEHPDPSQGWLANVYKAHEVMSNVYRRAFRVLCQDESDPLQILFHIDAVSSGAVPLLEALENSKAELGFQFSVQWLLDSAELFGKLVLHLREAAEKMKSRFVIVITHL